MLFQWLCIFFGSPQREADFWNPWNSQFHDAQNPSEKQGFIFDHKFHEIWCAQNASQRSLYCIFVVPAWDFLNFKESALPRITPLTFFLAAVRVPVHILDFCNTSQARIVFSSPHHRKCDRRPGFSPRAPNLQSSLLPLQSRMRNAALFWQFCRAHDFQDCDAPNPHESITFFTVSRFWHHHNCDSRARILNKLQKVASPR